MDTDWTDVTKEEAKAFSEKHDLKPITWSTLDSTWYFKEIQYTDATKKHYAYPGKDPWMIVSYSAGPTRFQISNDHIDQTPA